MDKDYRLWFLLFILQLGQISISEEPIVLYIPSENILVIPQTFFLTSVAKDGRHSKSGRFLKIGFAVATFRLFSRMFSTSHFILELNASNAFNRVSIDIK